MSFKKLSYQVILLLIVSMFAMPLKSGASAPISSSWYPEDLLEWSSENDPDAIYNQSTIPLENKEILFQMNDHAQTEAKVAALSALNPHTSGVPSQGGKEFFANTFSYWQYVDLMVYWAGSAGEGIIVPPSADVIDAAHKNGVPILGNIFFPPAVYGGKLDWVEQMVTQAEDGSFPAADKLIEVAEFYGFDGWFINQETEGGNTETALKIKRFIDYLQANKPENMQIMWYDSMIDNGKISWQNHLTDNNKDFFQRSDSMFLNFWWENQQVSAKKAKEMGRSPYDLYTGIDVEAKGTATKIPWEGIFPTGQDAFTSLGIYRPDWAFKTASNMKEFFEKEDQFWVGESGDPSDTVNNGDWKGLAHYFTAKTVINELPFVTNFNTGSGEVFAIEGEIASEQEWNNRSLQDILPTWRWIKQSDGTPLDIKFDWETAYYGGSSLEIFGDLNKKNSTNFKLYKMNVPIEKHTEIALTYKANSDEANVKVGVSFQDNPDNFTFFDVRKRSHGKWVTDQLKLHKHEGKRIAAVSLYIESAKTISDYTTNIGELKIYNKHENKVKAQSIKDMTWLEQNFKDGIYANLGFTWEKVNEEIRHYEIYRVMADGSRQWLAATPNNAYYLSNLKRNGNEPQTSLELIAVNEHNQRSKALPFSFEWPAYPKPIADFQVNKTVAMPGEEVQFLNKSSEVTEEVEWHFEGGTPESSVENNPVVSYAEEGTYSVRLTAKNSEGEDIETKESLITITEDAKNMMNLALNKVGSVSGQCAANEGAAQATDGIITNNSKWCSLDKNAWLELDLGEIKTISKFVLMHAGAGGEPAVLNTKAYTIKWSEDGMNWSEGVQITDNTLSTSEHSIAPAKAQYIRLGIQQPTQGGDQATRIFEMEVHGY